MAHIIADEKKLKRLVKYGFVTPQGIIYDEELAGPHGMDFILFPAKFHTEVDIHSAKEWFRICFDVVNIYMGDVNYGEKYPAEQTPIGITPEQREKAFRDILEYGCAPIENCRIVDTFTASAVVQVLDALSPKNKRSLLSRDTLQIINISWKLIGKSREKEEAE